MLKNAQECTRNILLVNLEIKRITNVQNKTAQKQQQQQNYIFESSLGEQGIKEGN